MKESKFANTKLINVRAMQSANFSMKIWNQEFSIKTMTYKKIKFRIDRKEQFCQKSSIIFSLRVHLLESYHGGIIAKTSWRRFFDFRIWLYLSNWCAKFSFFELWRYINRTDRRNKRCWNICKSRCLYLIEFIERGNSMTSCSWATWDRNKNFQ